MEFKISLIQQQTFRKQSIKKEKPAEIFLQVPLFSCQKTKRQRERRNRSKNLWGSVSLLRVLKQPSIYELFHYVIMTSRGFYIHHFFVKVRCFMPKSFSIIFRRLRFYFDSFIMIY